MAIKKANVVPGTFFGASPAFTNFYTVPVRQKADVVKFTIVNTDSGPQMVNVYIVRSGDSPTSVNQKAMNLNLESGRIYELGSGRGLLNAGDSIQGNATTGGVVALTADANIITE